MFYEEIFIGWANIGQEQSIFLEEFYRDLIFICFYPCKALAIREERGGRGKRGRSEGEKGKRRRKISRS